MQNDTIKIGISSCLLGELVRYDGSHKRDRFITDTLGRYFQWVPICPEVEIGLGTPRPTLRLEKREGQTRLMQPKTEMDLTAKMERYADKKVLGLKKLELSGYLLKSKSPSCGKGGIRIYSEPGVRPDTDGIGIFAKALLQEFPNLPVEDEGRLCDQNFRENWINRVFAYHDLQKMFADRPTVGKLVAFHSRYKYILLSHCHSTYRLLGQLVANAKKRPIGVVCAEYEMHLMDALKKKATRSKHTNVLLHMLGYFKKDLDAQTRKEILETIEDYKKELVPLIVPITLIRHYVRLLKISYLLEQTYLNPHPKELALRN